MFRPEEEEERLGLSQRVTIVPAKAVPRWKGKEGMARLPAARWRSSGVEQVQVTLMRASFGLGAWVGVWRRVGGAKGEGRTMEGWVLGAVIVVVVGC